MLLFSNTAWASNPWKEYQTHEEERLQLAGEVYLQEAIEDAAFPEYILKKLQRQLDILIQRYEKNPEDKDTLPRIQMIIRAIYIYQERGIDFHK